MTSLADLQAERDKLRALDAKEEFEAALAETCAHAELQAAALAVRRVLLAALEGLPARLAQAVAGERDETRAHYIMSDAAHDLLPVSRIAGWSANVLEQYANNRLM